MENPADIRGFHTENLELNIWIPLTQKYKDWTPCVRIEEVLLAIQALLTDPNPNNAMDRTIANQYLEDRAAFDETARLWTRKYAISD